MTGFVAQLGAVLGPVGALLQGGANAAEPGPAHRLRAHHPVLDHSAGPGCRRFAPGGCVAKPARRAAGGQGRGLGVGLGCGR
ncbi:hypothetical protein, partial [Aquabacterium sp. OR-4]|uniref:hypothetical protein n=1 Tax=Aquabacterium sp. OR-4 TaxID=2978127 RepID=UPI0028CA55A0